MRPFILALAALGVVISLASLGGCVDYKGSGNSFELEATILKVGKRSINVREYDVNYASGEADGWFDDHRTHQIHNNYNTCGFHHRHTVGKVFGDDGYEIELRDLYPGERVVIRGRIRSNASTCGKSPVYKKRPVYDSVTRIWP